MEYTGSSAATTSRQSHLSARYARRVFFPGGGITSSIPQWEQSHGGLTSIAASATRTSPRLLGFSERSNHNARSFGPDTRAAKQRILPGLLRTLIIVVYMTYQVFHKAIHRNVRTVVVQAKRPVGLYISVRSGTWPKRPPKRPLYVPASYVRIECAVIARFSMEIGGRSVAGPHVVPVQRSFIFLSA